MVLDPLGPAPYFSGTIVHYSYADLCRPTHHEFWHISPEDYVAALPSSRPPERARRGWRVTAGSSAARRPAATLSLRESSSYSPRTVDLRPSRARGHPRGHVEVRAQTSDVRAAALNHSRGCSEQIGQPIALEIDAILDFECMGLSGAQTLVEASDVRCASTTTASTARRPPPEPS